MNDHREDNVSLKFGAGGYYVEFSAPWKRVFAKSKPEPVLGLSERFLKLFRDHGVTVTQIPRLMPEIGLDQLQSPRHLLPALTPVVIEKAATLFGIRREWLEGSTTVMYEHLWCYKRPERFFEEFKALNTEKELYPLFALVSDMNFDQKRWRDQPIVLVMRDKLIDLGDREIYRYRVFGEGMIWSYWKCRYQIKLMVRLLHQLRETTVPVYCIKRDALRAVESGYSVPRMVLVGAKRPTTGWLEDFSLFPHESAKSKAPDELLCAIDYFSEYGLEGLVEAIMGEKLEPPRVVFENRRPHDFPSTPR